MFVPEVQMFVPEEHELEFQCINGTGRGEGEGISCLLPTVRVRKNNLSCYIIWQAKE